MSSSISESTRLLPQNFPNYELKPREPTHKELVQAYEKRLEELEFRAFGSFKQTDMDAYRRCCKILERLREGFRPIPDPQVPEDSPTFDPENPYYQMAELHQKI